ncbi:MAG TPA: P1 family peptidase, partial [Candidatus Sulfomarinibacteraceae bacterium]|nr:P1 family peptidase [Candidatus Sulfomarinibacteraceae bacterium]
MTRARLRDLGITIGTLPTGPHNAITDVDGVCVGHKTLIYDEPRVARTGVTIILPRDGAIWRDNAFAAFHSFNGCGEMTGVHWLQESGLLCYPIALTNTHHVGTVHEALVAYGQEKGLTTLSALAVVAETWDGWLNDMDAFHIGKEHVYEALEGAQSGPVEEGNVGGGTGMICHDFKGGIGTASRVCETDSGRFTVGALVQANHGDRADLRCDGAPLGRICDAAHTPLPWRTAQSGGSIIIVVATNAPLLPGQCHRLAQRAAVGFARAGGVGHNGSGDLFLAFATGNHLPAGAGEPGSVK